MSKKSDIICYRVRLVLGSDTTNPKKESLLIWYRYDRSIPLKTLATQSKSRLYYFKANKSKSKSEKRLCPQQTRMSALASELSWAGTVVDVVVVVVVDFG